MDSRTRSEHQPELINNQSLSGHNDTLQPSIHVSPDCVGKKDLMLPSITLGFNYGKSQFLYKEDLRELFEANHLQGKKNQPPQMLQESPLLSIDC